MSELLTTASCAVLGATLFSFLIGVVLGYFFSGTSAERSNRRALKKVRKLLREDDGTLRKLIEDALEKHEWKSDKRE